MKSNALRVGALVVAVAAIYACGDDPTAPAAGSTVTFSADLAAANEPTSNGSTGFGKFTGVLDTLTNVFTYDVTYSGLTSNVTLGHIHGPGDPGQTKAPILDFSTVPGSTFDKNVLAGAAHGQVTLTAATAFSQNIAGDSLRKLLFAGKTYANIHTVNNGGGEIRGQILLKQP